MILSNKDILQELNNGNIFISPFNKELLSYASYDVRLAGFFIEMFLPENCDPSFDGYTFKKHQTEAYFLQPKTRVLGRTMEQIGSNCNFITTEMKAKSTTGRWGLETCSCAGLGDPGYCSEWTMELYNKNDKTIVLKRNMVIAQIVFKYLKTPCDGLYKSKYSDSFTPEGQILPKNIEIFK